ATGGGRRLPGPPGDHRNSAQEVRAFSFRIKGVWPYLAKRNRIRVTVGGQALPIAGHGMFVHPPRNGEQSLSELRALFDTGHLLSQSGTIRLSKKLDVEWQQRVMRLYQKVRTIVRDAHGYDVFFVYGTLLGAVREGGYIGHDVDFDAAYVSATRTGREAAAELVDIAHTLIDAGLVVDARERLLHINDPDDPEDRIDLFHTYVDPEGHVQFPWGVAGTGVLDAREVAEVRELDFPGGSGLVPAHAEAVVAHLYGEDWRQPKPGWDWNLARADAALDGLLSTEQRTKVYWASFYARAGSSPGSSFFEHIEARPDTPRSIVDIGCGDGRDSCAFGAAGRSVLGIDQSRVGIRHAADHATSRGLGDTVRFLECDVSDREALTSVLKGQIESANGAVMFYLRFFLHAIDEAAQADLMEVLAAVARPGDMFAAEFRTVLDEAGAKVHGQHYRRYQDPDVFVESLEREHGFEVLYRHEGTGLSPYHEEDPHLCRVVARRRV
ncbi:MAG: methyltransferase domain-containing protein, partial [Nocardioides sp.]